MKARIDGKQWVASHMMPDEDANSSYLLIHGENGGEYMNFQLWKRGIELDKKFPINEDNAANLSLEDDAGFWGGKSGEIEITNWMALGWRVHFHTKLQAAAHQNLLRLQMVFSGCLFY